MSINEVDFKFAHNGAGLAAPHVLGIDTAGEIDGFGEDVSGWQPGQRMMALTNLYRWGAYAQYLVVDARVLSLLSEELSAAA